VVAGLGRLVGFWLSALSAGRRPSGHSPDEAEKSGPMFGNQQEWDA